MLDINKLSIYDSIGVRPLSSSGSKVFDIVIEVRNTNQVAHIVARANGLVELETTLGRYFKTFISSRKSVSKYKGKTVYRLRARGDIIADCLVWSR